MENFFFCVNAVLPSFLLIAAGFGVHNIGWLNDTGAKQINKLCFHLLLPLVMFKTAYTSSFSADFDPRLLLICVLCVLGIIAAMLIIAPRLTSSRGQIGVMVQASFRSNAVLLGLPFAISLCGEEAAGPMGVLVAFIVPIYNLLAVILLSIYTDKPDQKVNVKSVIINVINNPLIVMSITGFVLSGFNVTLPTVIQRPLFDLATAGSTIAMLGVGTQLNFKNAVRNLRLTLVSSVAKLIVLPIIGTYIAIALGIRGAALCVPFLILSTPSATGCASLADVMGADGALASEMIVFSTGASVVTIFLGSFVLKSFGLI